jgi:hypothetical protein
MDIPGGLGAEEGNYRRRTKCRQVVVDVVFEGDGGFR